MCVVDSNVDVGFGVSMDVFNVDAKIDVGVDEDVVGGRHGGSDVDILIWSVLVSESVGMSALEPSTRLNMRKVLVSTWPCATHTKPLSLWMHMAGPTFNLRLHTPCCVCEPSEKRSFGWM